MSELVFYVYILRCSDGSYYTGHTDNLDIRLAQHQQGIMRCYTLKRRPVELVFVETTNSRQYAVETEIQIKKWSRKKKEALIARDWNLLRELARCRSKEKKD